MKTYTIGMKNKIETRDVNFWYGDFHALKGISMDIEEKSVIAFIGRLWKVYLPAPAEPHERFDSRHPSDRRDTH